LSTELPTHTTTGQDIGERVKDESRSNCGGGEGRIEAAISRKFTSTTTKAMSHLAVTEENPVFKIQNLK